MGKGWRRRAAAGVGRRCGAALLALLALPALAAPTITFTGGPAPSERVAFRLLATAEYGGAAEGWKPLFELACGCVLTVRTVDDPLALLRALAKGEEAEAVVGLPLSALEDARATGRFAPHVRPAPLSLPVEWSDPTFTPISYGWLGFVYDTTRLTRAPSSFAELAKAGPNALRVAMDDPRASAVGLDAVLWLRATQKDKAGAVWEGMKPKLSIAPSRAAALAMLEKGEADLALAATTWPATTWPATTWPATRGEDGATRYRVTPFREGQFLQVETAAVVAGAAHPQIAAQFLAFLTTPEAQALVAARRGMYPVHPAAAVPAGFGAATLPSRPIALTSQEIAAERAGWLAERDAALAK